MRTQIESKQGNVIHIKTRLSRIEAKKVATSATLLSVALLVTMANTSLLNKSAVGPASGGGRGIASVESNAFSEDSENLKGWFKDFVESKSGKPSETATSPNDLDKLTYGDLEGAYAVKIEAGSIQEIDYVGTQVVESSPKLIKDKIDFIEKNKRLLNLNNTFIEKLGEESQGENRAEVYSAVAKDSQLVRNIRFITDNLGRMISMKVEAPKMERR